MIAEWMRQMAAFAGREGRRALRNTWLIVFAALALLGGALILYFVAPGSSGFLFLQMQLFLLPLFAVLIGCSSAQEDLEELPILFSQPLFRSAFLCGKWFALTVMLAVVTGLAMGSDAVVGRGESAPLLLWIHGVALSGVFAALGLVLGVSWQDRSRGLIASLLTWLALVFGCDALAWLAVQTRIAEQWPTAWVIALFANPPSVFRIGALLALKDIPFHVPTSQPATAWLLSHTLFLSPAVCVTWIVLTLALGSRRLHRGLDADGGLRRIFYRITPAKNRERPENRLLDSKARSNCQP
jgi:ABC-type transport system involved in multi-copper enzyme maturation permease subunit